MVHIIVGEKGKGKTKILLNKANETVKESKGNVVYLDKSNKHMYELSNKIRLINVKDYFVENSDKFIGFICGIISQDNDLEVIFLDSFLKVADLQANQIEPVIKALESISEHFHIDFVISISIKSEEVPESLKGNVMVSL